MKKSQLSKKATDARGEPVQRHRRTEKAKPADANDIAPPSQLALATPGSLSFVDLTMRSIRHQLIEKISNGVSRACMLAELDLLKKELAYHAAVPIERLLIDHILTVRLRLIHAEHNYNECVVGQSVPLTRGEYWDGLLSSTQARFLRAIETLARIQRLARNTPALQINISREGGKQVNVQGDVNEQRTSPSADRQ